MAITLADAALNTLSDVDLAVIDEFRKESWLLDNLTFDEAVNPVGGGATMTYAYTRLKTERSAAFRAVNNEYTAAQAERERVSTDLKQLGGVFQVDRVLAHNGPSQTDEVTFQMGQVIKSSTAKFQDEVINGDTGVDANGFDGLDKILTGASTEIIPGGSSMYVDWRLGTTINTEALSHSAIDLLDQLVAMLDSPATGLLMNKTMRTIVRGIARRAGFWTREKNEFGQVVEYFHDTPLIDLGAKPGSNNPIIPIETRDADGAGGGGNITSLTDIYAVSLGQDSVHGVKSSNGPLIQTWLPDFSTAGAVKKGEVELGPVALAVKKTKSIAVLRNIKVG